MTDKEKYTELMRRYWEAETTPEEERSLARYIARTDDPVFEELRGVLGYLSVGKAGGSRKERRIRVRLFTAAAAAGIAAVVALGISLLPDRAKPAADLCVSYAYGVQTSDSEAVMASVASSLADFFAGETPAEAQLTEMFQR